KEEAKDIVQEFFVDLLEKKRYVHLKGDIKGYFYRSITNRCFNKLRKTERERRRAECLVTDEAITDIQLDPNKNEKLYDKLQHAFSLLSVQRKEALKLVYVKDKRY